MKTSMIIANNVKKLREMQNLTQMQLAKRGKLPRSTIATIESGETSTSIDSLLKIAEALSITLDELVSKPRPKTLLIQSRDVPKNTKSSGGVTQHKILPDPIYGMEIDKLTLKPQARMRGVPHVRNTREYFTCVDGEIEIYCDGEKFTLHKGDVLAFPGDVAHSYYNSGNSNATGFSVVVLATIRHD